MKRLEAFRNTIFGEYDRYLAWHDGFDIDESALQNLEGSEKEIAEKEMLDSLASGSADPRVILGLQCLRSHKAVQLLNKQMAHFGVYAIDAIYYTCPEQLDPDTVCECIKIEHGGIVSGLKNFPTSLLPEKVLETIFEGLINAVDSLFRFELLSTIRHIYGLDELNRNNPLVPVERIFRIDEMLNSRIGHFNPEMLYKRDVIYDSCVMEETEITDRQEGVSLLRLQIAAKLTESDTKKTAFKYHKIDTLIHHLKAKAENIAVFSSDEIHPGSTHFYNTYFLKYEIEVEKYAVTRSFSTNFIAKPQQEIFLFQETEFRNWLAGFEGHKIPEHHP